MIAVLTTTGADTQTLWSHLYQAKFTSLDCSWIQIRPLVDYSDQDLIAMPSIFISKNNYWHPSWK